MLHSPFMFLPNIRTVLFSYRRPVLNLPIEICLIFLLWLGSIKHWPYLLSPMTRAVPSMYNRPVLNVCKEIMRTLTFLTPSRLHLPPFALDPKSLTDPFWYNTPVLKDPKLSCLTFIFSASLRLHCLYSLHPIKVIEVSSNKKPEWDNPSEMHVTFFLGRLEMSHCL